MKEQRKDERYLCRRPDSFLLSLNRFLIGFLASFTLFACTSEKPSEDAEDEVVLEDSTDTLNEDVDELVDSEEDVKPECNVPPRDLLGESCSQEGDNCVSYEEAPSCCLWSQCECKPRALEPGGDLLWYCAHVGCTECGSYFSCMHYPCGGDCPWSCDEGCISPIALPFSYPEVVCAPDDDGEGVDARPAE